MLTPYNKLKNLSTNYIKYLSIFLITGFLLTLAAPLSFAQQDQGIQELPQTIEEAKTLGERILWSFPEALKKIWREFLTIWKTMLGWFKSFWYSYISPLLQNIWYRINSFFGKEIEKRKPEIRKELEEEKEEIKKDVPKTTKTLWERFKNLIK